MKEKILNKGNAIVLPEAETAFFKLREGGENNFKRYLKDSSNAVKATYPKKVSQHAIALIEKRFGGTDQSILIAGHHSSGGSLLKLLLKKVAVGAAKRGLDNVGLWMVEQQHDGAYELKIYNDKPYEQK